MEQPTFDSDGYPTDETLEFIEQAKYGPDLWQFIRDAWNFRFGAIRDQPDGTIDFVTGGWSGNESIISAMHRNMMVRAIAWESSHRGGLHVYTPSSPGKAK